MPHSVQYTALGGNDITKYLKKMIDERVYTIDNKIARDIKEHLSYVSENFETETEN